MYQIIYKDWTLALFSKLSAYCSKILFSITINNFLIIVIPHDFIQGYVTVSLLLSIYKDFNKKKKKNKIKKKNRLMETN